MQDFCREKTTELRERSIICAVFSSFFFFALSHFLFHPFLAVALFSCRLWWEYWVRCYLIYKKKGLLMVFVSQAAAKKGGVNKKKFPIHTCLTGPCPCHVAKRRRSFFLAGHMLDWFVCRVSVLDASQIVSPLQKRTVNTRQWFLKKYYISAVYLPFANLRIYCTTLF